MTKYLLTALLIAIPILLAVKSPLSVTAELAGSLTLSQVQRGEKAYNGQCAMCHGANLEGGDAPALSGAAVTQRFDSAARLYEYLSSTMPPFAPGKMSKQEYLDITVHILGVNGNPPGQRELTPADLAAIDLDVYASGRSGVAPSGGVSQIAAATKAVPQAFTWTRKLPQHDSAQGQAAANPNRPTASIPERIDAAGEASSLLQSSRDYTLVSDEMLRNPPPHEWLQSRRTLDSQGYSPLRQINTANVNQLELAWAWPMAEGGQQETVPLVHNGIMFIATTNNVVQALDAVTGDLIWEYRHPQADMPSSWGYQRYQARRQKGSIALYKDKVVLTTADAKLVVLDALNGRVVWEKQVLDYTLGYTYTVAPLVVEGKIITGVGGCSTSGTAGGCYIMAHDFVTGAELWRFNIIDDPENPAQQRSWGDVPPAYRWGGTAWATGSYDPRTNTLFWGTGNPGPYMELLRGTGTGDVLYTNSTLALDATTGKRRWHYQHMPRDNWDMDSPFERILIDQEAGGGVTRLLVTVAGKNGIAFALDRDSGEFIWASETIYQNVVSNIDKHGRVSLNESIVPKALGEEHFVCPSLWGGKSWQAAAYSPISGMLYVPAAESCNTIAPIRAEFSAGNVIGSVTAGPRVLPPGIEEAGVIDAISIADGTRQWRHSQRTVPTSSLLTTAGGLVFGGDAGRYFMALDQMTGEVLWRTRLNAPIGGYPMTYQINGVQYLVVPTGYSAQAGSAAALFPETPLPSGSGNSLFVFRLRNTESNN